MNRQKRAKLIGMILGDGCLKLKTNNYVELCIQHSLKQIDYLEYKANKLHSFFGGKELKISRSKHTLTNGKTYTGYRISKQHNYFKTLHRLIYSNNLKKYYSARILEYLDAEGIAYWYMDDGGISKNKNNGRITSIECRLYTYCSEAEADTIITYFKKNYSIIGKKRLYKLNDSWIIVFNTKEAKKLESLIENFIIPSMQYKLPSYYLPRKQGILI